MCASALHIYLINYTPKFTGDDNLCRGYIKSHEIFVYTSTSNTPLDYSEGFICDI